MTLRRLQTASQSSVIAKTTWQSTTTSWHLPAAIATGDQIGGYLHMVKPTLTPDIWAPVERLRKCTAHPVLFLTI
jgi:hypothetical protein